MNRRLSIVLLLLLWGCARPAYEPLPLYPGLAGELLAAAARSGERFHSLKGLAKVSYRDASRSMSFSEALIVESPDRMRTEILGPFGGSLLQLSSDGRQMFLNLPRDGRFFSGPIDAASLRLLTGIDVPLDQLVGVVLYQVPLLSESPGALVPRGGDGYAVVLEQGGARQELWFDPQHRLVASFWSLDGSPTWQVEYAEFSAEDGFPLEQRVEDSTRGVALKVVLSSPVLNAEIRPELFRPLPPDGVSPEPFPDPARLQPSIP